MANQKQAAKAAAAAAQKAAQAKQEKRNMIIGIVAILLVAGVALFFVLGGNNAPADNTQPQVIAGGPSAASEIDAKATHNVTIEVENYGTITAELYGEVAPITVENFVKLANQGFYDGLTFHRIISGFMIQGGDPKGNGTGGSEENIKGEFKANGVENNIPHKRGVLSMARSMDNDSASSQFFIMHEVSPWLDGQYAAFGCVLEGMEVVDAICQNTPVTDGNGTVARANQPKIVSIKVTEAAE